MAALARNLTTTGAIHSTAFSPLMVCLTRALADCMPLRGLEGTAPPAYSRRRRRPRTACKPWASPPPSQQRRAVSPAPPSRAAGGRKTAPPSPVPAASPAAAAARALPRDQEPRAGGAPLSLARSEKRRRSVRCSRPRPPPRRAAARSPDGAPMQRRGKRGGEGQLEAWEGVQTQVGGADAGCGEARCGTRGNTRCG